MFFYYRSRIKLNCFWIRTKTMLLLNTRRSWELQNVLLYLVCFQHQWRNPQNSQSFLLLALASRHVCIFFSNIFCSFLFIHAITQSIHIESSYVPLYTLQQQLQSLLEALNTTEPHYIRCVKPNNLLKPSIFENHNVLQQLCCGVRKCLEFFSYW